MMRSVAGPRLLPAVAALAAFSGCYAHNPYGYPGYYGTPAYQPAPIQTLTPGQQYIPGGTSPGMVLPQGTTPTYQNPGGGLQPIPDGGSNAPPYNSGSGGNMNVPDPYFPNGNSSTYQMNSPAMPVGNAIQPANHQMAEPNQLQSLPDGLREVSSQPQPVQAAASNPWAEQASETYNPAPAAALPGADAFELPRTVEQPSTNPFAAQEPRPDPYETMPALDLKANKISPTALRPFGHDPKYKWLRGVVSREPQDGSWCIVYEDDPQPEDQLAGHVSLAPSPYLEELKDGDVVEVQGQIDPIARDPQGKPVYLILKLTKLVEGTDDARMH